jgi:hypothetical protein
VLGSTPDCTESGYTSDKGRNRGTRILGTGGPLESESCSRLPRRPIRNKARLASASSHRPERGSLERVRRLGGLKYQGRRRLSRGVCGLANLPVGMFSSSTGCSCIGCRDERWVCFTRCMDPILRGLSLLEAVVGCCCKDAASAKKRRRRRRLHGGPGCLDIIYLGRLVNINPGTPLPSFGFFHQLYRQSRQ